MGETSLHFNVPASFPSRVRDTLTVQLNVAPYVDSMIPDQFIFEPIITALEKRSYLRSTFAASEFHKKLFFPTSALSLHIFRPF